MVPVTQIHPFTNSSARTCSKFITPLAKPGSVPSSSSFHKAFCNQLLFPMSLSLSPLRIPIFLFMGDTPTVASRKSGDGPPPAFLGDFSNSFLKGDNQCSPPGALAEQSSSTTPSATVSTVCSISAGEKLLSRSTSRLKT